MCPRAAVAAAGAAAALKSKKHSEEQGKEKLCGMSGEQIKLLKCLNSL